mgnify:CR=1 FL=1
MAAPAKREFNLGQVEAEVKKTDTAKNPIFPSGNIATPVTRPLEKKTKPKTPPVAPSVEHAKNVTAAASATPAAVDPIQ